MFELRKSYRFEAAHSLPHLPPVHKCHNLHGHSYSVTVALMGESLNRDGMLRDFLDVDAYMHPLIDMYDHVNLNDHFPVTTCEALACSIYNMLKPGLKELKSVQVSETPKTSATYSYSDLIGVCDVV